MIFRLLALLSLLATSAASVTASDIWVTAYYAGWMQGNQWSFHLRPENIDFEAVTHIVHFSLGPKADGTVDGEGNGITPESSAEIVKAGHKAGKKVLICIGGWNSERGFASATRRETREHFIMNLLSFVQSRGYDGIDIDWEPVSRDYTDQYGAFLRDLRKAMQAVNPGLLLTVACNSAPELFAKVHPVLDQINIMTYDYAGAWPGWFTWHNAAIYDGGARFPSNGAAPPAIHTHVREFLDAGVPAKKLGIGIDFYGYVWNSGNGTPTGGVTAPRQTWNSAPWVKDNVPYYQIMESFFDPGFYRWDSSAQAAYLAIDKPGSADDKFVSYDDATSCRRKVAYAREQGLGGVIIWELGGGWAPKTDKPDGLLQAVKEELLAR
ncbi:MAG: glycoside hydrolase family 18 protein [Bacteroidetes bacterium]|nr:glycoside hydrolase family 18 protein [Bacteroidota bacterium]